KLIDLHMAASVLNGRRVASNVRLLVAPASTRIAAEAAADGTLATLTAAGAILLASGCGACAGYGSGLLSEGEVCIASTARNFKGRMGGRQHRSISVRPTPWRQAPSLAASPTRGRSWRTARHEWKTRVALRRQYRHRRAGARHLYEKADCRTRRPLPRSGRAAFRQGGAAGGCRGWRPRLRHGIVTRASG